MKEILVGYSGFVGSNLISSHHFDGLYDSKNVEESYGSNPDILVYSGVPAQKFIANKFPEQDFEVIQGAIKNITKINPKMVVLISTIDVYNDPTSATENTIIDEDALEPYGKNRRFLENWVGKNYEKRLIVRLPALYGKNLKKNFIYDMINYIPQMLKQDLYENLISKDPRLNEYYKLNDNGFYQVRNLTKEEIKDLKEIFKHLNFSALQFTDSRSVYQFYNLKYLWSHIEKALEENISLLNLATEPVSAEEIYGYIKGETFVNHISQKPAKYNYKTIYAEKFDGQNGYIYNKDFILEDLKDYVERNEK